MVDMISSLGRFEMCLKPLDSLVFCHQAVLQHLFVFKVFTNTEAMTSTWVDFHLAWNIFLGQDLFQLFHLFHREQRVLISNRNTVWPIHRINVRRQTQHRRMSRKHSINKRFPCARHAILLRKKRNVLSTPTEPCRSDWHVFLLRVLRLTELRHEGLDMRKGHSRSVVIKER